MKNKINQRRYKAQQQAGNRYEHFIKWSLLNEGWDIEYTGALKYDDHGIDMIARKDGVTRYVQCKGWSWWKELREDVVYQLEGAVHAAAGEDYRERNVEAYIYSSAKLHPFAQAEADKLGITFVHKEFPSNWNRKHPYHKHRKNLR